MEQFQRKVTRKTGSLETKSYDGLLRDLVCLAWRKFKRVVCKFLKIALLKEKENVAKSKTKIKET